MTPEDKSNPEILGEATLPSAESDTRRGLVLQRYFLLKLLFERLLVRMKDRLSFLGIDSTDNRILSICNPVSIVALSTTAKTRKQPKCPSMDSQTKDMCSPQAMKCYSALERKDILTGYNVDEPGKGHDAP